VVLRAPLNDRHQFVTLLVLVLVLMLVSVRSKLQLQERWDASVSVKCNLRPLRVAQGRLQKYGYAVN
jgi:hypothetical protein